MKRVAPFDPVEWLPQLKSQTIRLQHVMDDSVTPRSVTCGTSTTACRSFSFAHTVSGGADTFTAPAIPPAGGTVTIAATATASKTTSASSTVAITSVGQAGLLLGQFAFHLAGTDSKGFYTEAGSVTLSAGVVTAGEEDYFDGAANNDINFSIVVGPNSQHSIDPNGDGRGSLTLETGQSTVGVLGIQTFSLTVVNTPQHALITELDSSATSSGSLDLQTTADLKMASITGSYAFLFSGFDFSNYPEAQPLAEGGVVTANGAARLKPGGWEPLTTMGK